MFCHFKARASAGRIPLSFEDLKNVDDMLDSGEAVIIPVGQLFERFEIQYGLKPEYMVLSSEFDIKCRTTRIGEHVVLLPFDFCMKLIDLSGVHKRKQAFWVKESAGAGILRPV